MILTSFLELCMLSSSSPSSSSSSSSSLLPSLHLILLLLFLVVGTFKAEWFLVTGWLQTIVVGAELFEEPLRGWGLWMVESSEGVEEGN